VIEETKYEPEMPTVAGVYINRINRGIPLQADPTIKFALNKPGITRILNQDLKIESPYNTYIHTGLPPGPITIAPKVAIDAVLNYKRHNYIYFCAKETFDGQHNFSETYSEHINNARAYHAALNAKKITR
ncbi:MAG: endolytic transglycosylase MltG, partial [Bacteroidales bacterium]|nr:endolytic transglycosylase MltG [Bacteroidales bacterium]